MLACPCDRLAELVEAAVVLADEECHVKGHERGRDVHRVHVAFDFEQPAGDDAAQIPHGAFIGNADPRLVYPVRREIHVGCLEAAQRATAEITCG